MIDLVINKKDFIGVMGYDVFIVVFNDKFELLFNYFK